MERRAVLRGLAVLSAGLAGCSGDTDETGGATPPPDAMPTSPPRSDDEIGTPVGSETGATPTTAASHAFSVPNANFSFAESEDGNLVVRLPVRNDAPDHRRGMVNVSVLVEEEVVYERQPVELDSGDTREYNVTMPVDYETWTRNRNIQHIRFEPPDDG
jgi:hypothetical protein